jgi:hypothetical protein
MAKQPADLRERVITAADAVLEAQGSIGPLELLQQMSLLMPGHVFNWRKGIIDALAPQIQGSPEKLQRTFAYFEQWASTRGLKPIEVPYTRPTPAGAVPLRVTPDGDAVQERLFCTHYVRTDLTEHKTQHITKQLTKPADLVVFQTVSDSVTCSECKTEIHKNGFLFMEKGQPLCLTCADLDHLDFLPRGDATLTRRAHKHSPLSAVVVRFARARNRYERQGILVTPEAIEAGGEECRADQDKRAARRPEYVLRREREDQKLAEAMAQAIREIYPGCPAQKARRIAQHTAERSSGRVGRSAAGRSLDRDALVLAVKAWVRHTHTDYDKLLMKGVDRLEARSIVQDEIRAALAKWSLDD